MRKIPVIFNHDHTKVIGTIKFDDEITDEFLSDNNMSIVWVSSYPANKTIAVSLVPNSEEVEGANNDANRSN